MLGFMTRIFSIRLFALAALLLAVCALNARAAPNAQAVDDLETPRLLGFSILNPNPLPGQQLQISYSAADASTLGGVAFFFVSPIGELVVAQASPVGPGQPPPATATLTIGSFAAAGTYTMIRATAGDQASHPNYVDCFSNGASPVASPGSTLPPTPPPICPVNMAASFTVVNANQDINLPTFTSNPVLPTGEFHVGDAVEVNFTASDGSGSGLSVVTFFYEALDAQNNILGSFAIGTTNQSLPLGKASAGVSLNWPTGRYRLTGAIIFDNLDQSLTYQVGGTTFRSPSGASGPNSHNFDFSVEFTVVNEQLDTTPPVLGSTITRTGPNAPAPGDTVSMSYSATDDLSGVFLVSFLFTGPANVVTFVSAFAPNAASGPATLTLGPNFVPGFYRLDSIFVKDIANNQAFYLRDGTVIAHPSFPTHPLGAQMVAADFTAVAASASDVTSISPDHAKAGGPTGFTLHVTGSGFTAQSKVAFGAGFASTTFISSTALDAEITAGMISGGARTVNVSVTTTAPPIAPTGATGTPLAASLPFELTATSTSDINRNGCVNGTDALALLRVLAGLPVATDGNCQVAAQTPTNTDADDDGFTDVRDALYIRKVVAGLLPQ